MARKFYKDEENPYDAMPQASSSQRYVDPTTQLIPNSVPQPLIRNIDEAGRRIDTALSGTVKVGVSTNTGGINRADTSSDIVFWAGATQEDRATAPFRVSAAGALTATRISAPNLVVYDAIVDAAGNGDYLLLSAAVTAGAKRIFVRAGTYTEPATITISTANTYIFGESLTTTIIILGNGADVDLISVSADSFSISNLTLHGNSSNQTLTTISALRINNSDNSIVDNIKITQVKGNNIHVGNSVSVEYLIISNCFIEATSSLSGIVLDTLTLSALVNNNTIYNVGSYAIEYLTANSLGIKIIGNTFFSGSRGLLISSASLANITGNSFANFDKDGILITKSTDNVINGNSFYQNGQSIDNTYYDLYIQSNGSTASKRNVITGNVFFTNSGSGVAYNIFEESGGVANNYNNVVGNITAKGKTGGVSISGANTGNTGNVNEV